MGGALSGERWRRAKPASPMAGARVTGSGSNLELHSGDRSRRVGRDSMPQNPAPTESSAWPVRENRAWDGRRVHNHKSNPAGPKVRNIPSSACFWKASFLPTDSAIKPEFHPWSNRRFETKLGDTRVGVADIRGRKALEIQQQDIHRRGAKHSD